MATVESLLEKAPPSDLERNWPWLRSRIPLKDDDPKECPKYEPLAMQVAEASMLQNDGERPFLVCEYNQVVKESKECCRSPWTNRVYSNSEINITDTALEVTNEEFRRLEITFNEVWDAYKNLYYGHESVGSVYLKELKDGSFLGWFGILKSVDMNGSSSASSWKSASMVRVDVSNGTQVHYAVDTFVCLVLAPCVEGDDDATTHTTAQVSATLSKNSTKTCVLQPEKLPIHVSHVEQIGTMIEANEIDLRSNVERVMIPKNQEILSSLQKKEIRRPLVNPLMGMVMNSDLLKKRLAKAASETEES